MYNDEQILIKLEGASAGLKVSKEKLFQLLKGEINQAGWISINNLYAELLLLNDWEVVSQMIPQSKWSEALSDNVIRILFPRSLRDKYLPIRDRLLLSNAII